MAVLKSSSSLVFVSVLICVFGIALVSPNSENDNLSGNVTNSSTLNSRLRSKRQSAGDGGGSTQVTGLRLKRETGERDVRDLNAAVNSQPPGRGKRSISFNFEKSLNFGHGGGVHSSYSPRKFSYGYIYRTDVPGPITSYHHDSSYSFPYSIYTTQDHTTVPVSVPVPVPEVSSRGPSHEILTETQRRFSLINTDYPSAQAFQQSSPIQSSRVLRESIVLDPNGLKCEQVCDVDGPGFGLLGFCTPYYCKCEVWEWKFYNLQCASNQVFDPTTLSCKSPQESLLCADLPENERSHDFGHNNVDFEHNGGWTSSSEEISHQAPPPVRTSYEIRTGWHI